MLVILLKRKFLKMEKKQFSLDYNIRPSNLGIENSKVIFLIHGFGADKNDLFSFASYLPVNLTVIALQAPHAMPFGGRAWYNIELENGEPVSDVKQAAESVEVINDFISECVDGYSFNKNEIFVLGFSQGAILSYAIASKYPEKYKYFLTLSGFAMQEILEVDNNKDYSNLDFYAAHGTMDGVISIERGRTAQKLLQDINAKHIYHEFPAGHSIAQKEFEEIIEWLKERV